MMNRLLASTACALALVAPPENALAQATVPATTAVLSEADEDARLVEAAARRAADDPVWGALLRDNFGQVAWNTFGTFDLAQMLALPAVFKEYTPPTVSAPIADLADRTEALVAAVTKTNAAPIAAGEAVTKLSFAAPTPVTTTTRDLGNGISENRYFMMHMAQTFDGVYDRSHAQKAGFSRLRNADESWVQIDYGDGAMVIREPANRFAPAQLNVGRFVNTSAKDVAIAYDYRTNSMRGNPRTSAYHNTYIRPLMADMPPLGSNVAWTVNLSAEKLGVGTARSEEFKMEVKRTYFKHADTPYVILEYTVPEFVYGGALGEKVMHRARGVALADPAMGQIYWNTSLQTATAIDADGRPRPYRYARTSFAMDGMAQPILDLNLIPEIKRYLDEFYRAEATAPLPIAGTGSVDQTPLEMASKIDIAGFTLAENSANQMGEAIGSGAFGENGNGQAAGAAVDALSNDVVFVISDKMKTFLEGINSAGAFDSQIMRQNVRSAEDFFRVTGITSTDMYYAEKRLADMADMGAALRTRITSISNQLTWLNKTILAQTQQLARAEAGLTVENFFMVYDGALVKSLKDNETRAKYLTQQLVALNNDITRNANLANEAAEAFKPLKIVQTVLQNRGILSVASKFNALLTNTKIALGMSVVSNLNNASTIYGVRQNLANFDPEAPGELNLQGKYNSGGALAGDLTLNLMAIVGNAAAGNVKSLISDVAAFSVGRFSDLWMAREAAHAAQGQAQYAFMQQVLTARRSAIQDKTHIDQLLTQLTGLGGRIDALQQERNQASGNARRPGGVNDPNWTDPRFDQRTGYPIPSYWAYLKANSPETLVRLGIDPDAPVGGWPNGVPPQTAQQTTQPRQPGGAAYPTRDPTTVARRPAPPREETLEEIAARGSTRPPRTPPAPYTPPPRPPARDDRLYTDENPITRTATTPFDVQPVTFDPVTSAPVEWTPVTWTPPTWEPPTWEPPTWTPPSFDAPLPSDIPWTDLNSGRNWPRLGGNMAYGYGDMSGQVATDLSAYEGWLRTQNQTYLEQLARTAGYPNLASALSDSASLLRKANDPAFYTWAWSPPAVSGAIGIQFSEGQHEMGRAAYLLGDLLKLSGLFNGEGGLIVAGLDGLDDPSKQSLNGRGRNGLSGPQDNAELTDAAYGSRYQIQSDPTGRLARETGGRLAGSLFSFEDPYLRELTANGIGGLDTLLAQPFNVVLTWGQGAFDLDLHMTGPLGEDTSNRFHIYFDQPGELEAQPFAALIKDCICNAGSEVILTSALNRGGIYRVSVFNFGDAAATSTNLANASNAQIQIVRGGTTESVGNGTTIVGGRTILTTSVPQGRPGNTWVAAELDPRNGRITVPATIVQSSNSGAVQ